LQSSALAKARFEQQTAYKIISMRSISMEIGTKQLVQRCDASACVWLDAASLYSDVKSPICQALEPKANVQETDQPDHKSGQSRMHAYTQPAHSEGMPEFF
jgi:hypothetical protein